MKNLRIIEVQVIDNQNIQVSFTENLTKNLITSNVSIISETGTAPSAQVSAISVSKNILYISCLPLTPYAVYYLQFNSTQYEPFISINGDAKLIEDNISNRYMIIGPLNDDNPIKTYIKNYLRQNIYSIDDNTTLVSKYIDALSLNFSKALYDIGQVKNENYLSITVDNEKKIRGKGPYDRLNEEAAYEILRVSKMPSASPGSLNLTYPIFPSYPISLQQNNNSETLSTNSVNDQGIFNVNDLILNLSKSTIIKANSIKFIFDDETPDYIYNIEIYGYQLLSSRYDQDYASTYYSLEDNQIRLNNLFLDDGVFDINKVNSNTKVYVDYDYKNLGYVINENTVSVIAVKDATRETLPPIINVFNLKHAPIVDSSNNIPTSNGITFIDPNSFNNSKHPAFLMEIPFRLEALPMLPGQYSIDYSTATVYVFGADLNNDGTGNYPPLATYKYRYTYQSQIDYAYDNTTSDIVALPYGNLIDNYGLISFNYEIVLVPGVDYIAQLHNEELSERIDNRLVALNVLKTNNSPITNVFRIYNETSGEVYFLNRWNDNKIYFRYTNPPNIQEKISEKTTFNNIINELLFISSILTNSSLIKIFKIQLNNNTIISSTDDCIGSSINTSVYFSNTIIFNKEKWFDVTQTIDQNINKLEIGQYCIDYINGVVYCAVEDEQEADIGFINYKNNNIKTQNKHLISIEDIYYQINPLSVKNKQFSYISYDDNFVIPENLDISDERLLNNNDNYLYQVSNNNVGVYDENANFVEGITNQIKSLRGIFEYQDLLNNINPLNFANYSTFSGNYITVGSITGQVYDTIKYDPIDGYYLLIDQTISYLSPNITYTISAIRQSDLTQLWNDDCEIELSYNNTSRLLLRSLPVSVSVGQIINVSYNFSINSSSFVIIDYNKGDLYIDYTYLADEIIVSYEYGDNVLDFRTSDTLATSEEYYVSYKAGALRDALYKNFGNLVNIPELTTFNIDFERERYRDALTAALTSFIQGPTINAMKNIGKTISHIEPEIIESIFENWSLGNSILMPQEISTTGEFSLLPAKYNFGALVNNNSQSITLPTNSNIKFEEGTFETWIIPQWNGIDNDAELSFTVLKNNSAIDPINVFIGAAEEHPSSHIFSLTKDILVGEPNLNKDGVFIYYNNDGYVDRWYIQIRDGYIGSPANYKIQLVSTGIFFDSHSINLPKPSNLSTTTSLNKLTFTLTNSSVVDEGITFVSDIRHYLLDLGEEKQNRLSLYKDVSGYFNFEVLDKNKQKYLVSADVSDWLANEPHHVAISWKLNTIDDKDEMHLFIDGFEVPNIIKFGQSLPAFNNERFRTVNPEEIIASSTRDIIGSTDLSTTKDGYTISSSISFNNYSIFAGDKIYIDEAGFSASGYTIDVGGIGGNTLTLTEPMPYTITNGTFSVNRTSYTVNTPINIAPNIAVYTIHDGYTEENELPGVRALTPSYSITEDGYYNSILTISNNVKANDLILIKTLGLNYRKINTKYYVWGNNVENYLMTKLPTPVSLNEVKIIKQLLQSSAIKVDGSYTYNISSNIYQPTNIVKGRTIQASISGTNVDFSIPVQITINGVSGSSTISEVLTFNDYGDGYTTNLFRSINYIDAYAKPINPLKSTLNIELNEKYPITYNEGGIYPTLRYSYYINQGTTLVKDGYDWIRDDNNQFSDQNVGDYIIIQYPPTVAGAYEIIGISSDRKSLQVNSPTISKPLPAFINGRYIILNTLAYNSGFQNGLFTFEVNDKPGQPFYLSKGFYNIEYYTFNSIKFDPINNNIYFGTDLNNSNNINAIIDQVKIYSNMLTDTRIGEVVAAGETSITKDFNSIKALKKDEQTLVLINFDQFPFSNDVDYYISNTKTFLSSKKVNDNFNSSLILLDKPKVIFNDGILDTRKEASIEFWVSPLYDTYNDPNIRYYFDAFGSVIEELESYDDFTVEINTSINSIISVNLKDGDQNIDYYAGGSIEINNQITTIHLNKKLPNNKSNVIVKYIPSGMQGDRISLYKDEFGYMNFSITASYNKYFIRAPIIWSKNTWHRIKISYIFNSKNDAMYMFLDGYNYSSDQYGSVELLNSLNTISTSLAFKNIVFNDSINNISFGTAYDNKYPSYLLINNLKISNISNITFAPYGELMDINYNSNLNVVYPVSEDLFTTYLLDINYEIVRTEDFSILRDRTTGMFDFSINVFDTLGIIGDNIKVKNTLEKLIKVLKPANSKAYIKII